MGSMYYDGTNMGSETYGFIVGSMAFPISSTPRVRSATFAQKSGGIRQGGYRDMMTLQVNGKVIGTSWDDIKLKADAIKKLLDPLDGDKAIIFDERIDREWTGRLTSPIMPPVMGCSAFDMQLTFLVDAESTDTTTTTQTFTIATNPDTITIPASGTVAGNVRALPVIKIKNTNASNLGGVTIANTTTSQTIFANVGVEQNKWVRFDTERQIVEQSPDDSTWNSVMNTIDSAEKTFPELQDGVSNSITVTGVADGIVTITYKARY